jgi:hypothetical protein
MRKTGGEISMEMRQQLLSGTMLPARAPVLASMWPGPDETIWIERAKEIEAIGIEALRVGQAVGLGSAEWEVYNRDGSFRGTVRLPANFHVHEFVGSLIYGVEVDELGVQIVKRLRVELN